MNDYSQLNFSHVFPLCTSIAVLKHLDKIHATQQKSRRSSKFDTKKNKNFLEKEMIFRKIILWTRGWQLWPPSKTFFQMKLLYFWLKVQRISKQCPKVQTMFFLKNFQGHVGWSFDDSGEFFRQNKKKVHSESSKKSKLCFIRKYFL